MHKTLHKTSLFMHTHTPKGCAPFCAVESISGLPDTLFKSFSTLKDTKNTPKAMRLTTKQYKPVNKYKPPQRDRAYFITT